MFNEFISVEVMGTFVGLSSAVALVTQFTKKPLKEKFGDFIVRPYAFVIALIFTTAFIRPDGVNLLQNIIMTVVNSLIIALASFGVYDVVADPKAKKRKM